MESNNVENVDPICGQICLEPADGRGPMQLDDGPVEQHPVEMFKARVEDEQLAKNASVVTAGGWPSLSVFPSTQNPPRSDAPLS